MTVDITSYKNAMAQLACGVTIVTSRFENRLFAMTASAFTSVTLGPPTVLVCVDKKSNMSKIISQSKCFAVNILGADQEDLGMAFAKPDRDCDALLQKIGFHEAKTKSPILNKQLAWLDCKLHHLHDSGDHLVFFGEVLACKASESKTPLIYYQREWRSLA